MKGQINILVDYDNIDQRIRSSGLRHVIDKILYALPESVLNSAEILRFRLYGGWYQESSLTRAAQRLAATALEDFPRIERIGAVGQRLSLQVELAYSLHVLPEMHLFYTFREQSYPRNLACRDPKDLGCSEPSCPFRAVHRFIAQDATCTIPECPRRIDDIVFRRQQKLVDEMITADLIYLASTGASVVTVVGSDDDLLPGLIGAAKGGAAVLQIHTQPSGRSVVPRLMETAGLAAKYESMEM